MHDECEGLVLFTGQKYVHDWLVIEEGLSLVCLSVRLHFEFGTTKVIVVRFMQVLPPPFQKGEIITLGWPY